MKVWATKFPFSRYWLKPHKKKLLRRDLVNRDWAQIAKVLRVEQTEQLWQGKFIKPVAQEVSQGFGHRQIVNGRRAGNHRGVDFASPIGTEVRAPNKGRVVFRKYLEVFGGTMVIDHGQGVQTIYFHLAKCYPEVGQMVEKGRVIALSGNSGVSSGPHLHWGMSVHDLRVDPLQWTKHEI
jgi:murein DD-endopeptidase MepM/ murein hydrolase activator NlpD